MNDRTTVAIPLASVRGKMKARATPKGRQVDLNARAEIAALLAGREIRRDLLIEYLHLIQDKFGHLSAAHMNTLAEAMKISQTEVYEVATFYHHFDIVKEGETAPPQLTVRVCETLSCAMAGADELLAKLPDILGRDVRVIAAPCIGRCAEAPAVCVGQNAFGHAMVDDVVACVKSNDVHARDTPSPFTGEGRGGGGEKDAQTHPHPNLPPSRRKGSPHEIGLAAYLAQGGYALYREVLAGAHDVESILKTMEDSGLRGLGGAGFPAGRKWRIVRAESGPRLMAVNIDEGEPGTFKDRHYLERDPHRFLEGMLIAAHVVGCEAIYIYLRDEYHQCRELLTQELAAMQVYLGGSGVTHPHPNPPLEGEGTDRDSLLSAPPLSRGRPGGGWGAITLPHIELRRGAGAYICGEESAMIESIEGKRGMPRLRPPYVAQVGLFGRPTLEHNFETLYWVRDILQKGAAWFASQGRHGRKGLRSFSVSGRVKKPGVHLAPAGITVKELIDECCGGMIDGHQFYAYLPGGASGGILPASMGDIPLDFDTLQPHGCFIGSAAVIILSQRDKARDAALNLMKFFADESCGQCTPCRVGTEKAVKLLEESKWRTGLLEELNQAMADASICGLGQAAPNPIRCVVKHFAHEIY